MQVNFILHTNGAITNAENEIIGFWDKAENILHFDRKEYAVESQEHVEAILENWFEMEAYGAYDGNPYSGSYL